MKKTVKTPSKYMLAISAAVLVILVILGIVLGNALNTPRMRVMRAIAHFSGTTLRSPDCVFYDIDIMEFLHRYANSDVSYQGELTVSDLKGVGLAVNIPFDGIRSFEQRKMSLNGSLSILRMNLCDMALYAADNTVYVSIPQLEIANGIPVETDLFVPMPGSDSDSNESWFSRNKQNLKKLSKEVIITPTGNTVTDENKIKSEEFLVTIPAGKGDFIWNSLGLEGPDRDVTVSLFITNTNRLNRLEVDLSHILPGASLTIEGNNASTLFLHYPLSEDENLDLTISRNGSTANRFDVIASCQAKDKEDYLITAAVSWKDLETGFDIEFSEGTVSINNELFCHFLFNSSLTPLEHAAKVFADAPADMASFEETTPEELGERIREKVENILGLLNSFFF